jgi:phosphate/sulfate permease
MSEAVAAALPARPNLNTRPHVAGGVIFIVLLAIGVGYTLNGLLADIDAAHTPPVAIGAFVLLGIALLIALGFEFVNGFHDTANAVATVIYTHSLPPHAAVVWSGAFNFLGVMVSSGAVAFSVLSLLPVELILQVGGSAGFAMIFALLIAAIVWNLGTWWLGLPASSSHTLIGSIIGVGLANQFMAPSGSGTSGVDWSQAMGVFRALLFSPGVGFIFAAFMLLVMKLVIRNKALYADLRSAAAGVDPGPADPHLHGRIVRARLERWAEGHGAHYADFDRLGADRVRVEPRYAEKRDSGVLSGDRPGAGGLHRARGRRDGALGRCGARHRHPCRTGPPNRRPGDLGGARHPRRRCCRTGPCTRRDERHSCHRRAERAQRHVPRQRGDSTGSEGGAFPAGRGGADGLSRGG